MKKLFLLTVFLAGILAGAFAQKRTQLINNLPADTVYGKNDTAVIYTPLMEDECNYSAQLKATFLGAADSAYMTFQTFQTNMHHDFEDDFTWTNLTDLDSVGWVTTTTNTGYLIEIENFSGTWLKHLVIGQGEDTVSIKGYIILK
jgi:hypothetical protein